FPEPLFLVYFILTPGRNSLGKPKVLEISDAALLRSQLLIFRVPTVVDRIDRPGSRPKSFKAVPRATDAALVVLAINEVHEMPEEAVLRVFFVAYDVYLPLRFVSVDEVLDK